MMTVQRGRGERVEEKKEGGRSLGAVFRDVVPPIVLFVRLSLIARLFASPNALYATPSISKSNI